MRLPVSSVEITGVMARTCGTSTPTALGEGSDRLGKGWLGRSLLRRCPQGASPGLGARRKVLTPCLAVPGPQIPTFLRDMVAFEVADRTAGHIRDCRELSGWPANK